MTKTYIIHYELYNIEGKKFKEGTVKLKNKYSELQAKIGAETNLKKLYPNMNKLIITSCIPDNPFGALGDIFGDIFK